MLVSNLHFGVAFYQWPALAIVCLLFLLCSLGLGLLISAFSRTQTQAIQFSVFFLLPVFVLSGAFAPLRTITNQAVRYIPSFSRSHIFAVLSAGEHVSRGPAILCSISWFCWPGQ